jgi:ribosome maturation factor RimP
LATPLEQKLTQIVEPLLDADGIDLVQLSLLGEGRGTILQILAENRETHTLDLDTCTRLSRTIGTHLEVEDVIKSMYRLEISSPGLDRPLTKPAHFTRYLGSEVKIETTLPLVQEGSTTPQRRFHGVIVSSNDDTVTIETDTGPVTLEHLNINRAKLKPRDDFFGTPKKEKPKTNTKPDTDKPKTDKARTPKGVAQK